MGTDTDVEKLRATFREFGCPGVVALIDFLASPEGKGCMCIGSSTLGLDQIMNEIFLNEEARMLSAWFRTRKLHIGSNDGSVTPLQWLSRLSGVFGNVSRPAQEYFDKCCGEYARTASRISRSTGYVEIMNKNGTFRVPRSKANLEMSDTELEPYRVEQSELF